MSIPTVKLILFITLSLSPLLYANEPKVIFMNGIQTVQQDAEVSAAATAELLGLSSDSVPLLYNETEGLLSDLWETHRLQSREESILDEIKRNKNFWNIYLRQSDLAMAGKYVATPILPDSIDIFKMVRELKSYTNKFTKPIVVVAHSQGNLVTNAVVERMRAQDRVYARNCIAMVSVATPSVYVTNGGNHTTSRQDDVISTSRITYSDILPANIDAGLQGDIWLGHGYREVYLRSSGNTKAREKIKRDIEEAITSLKSSCKMDTPVVQACGTPVGESGGYDSRPQYFSYLIPSNASGVQDVTFNFEAFFIPDGFEASANGQTLYSTEGKVSGYHQKAIKYDAARYGNKIDIKVDATKSGTAWKFCAACASDANNTCSGTVDMKKTKQAIRHSYSMKWVCNVYDIRVNGSSLSISQTASLTRGRHRLTYKGGCECSDSSYVDRCKYDPAPVWQLPGIEGENVVRFPRGNKYIHSLYFNN